jgi:hypothetical protein
MSEKDEDIGMVARRRHLTHCSMAATEARQQIAIRHLLTELRQHSPASLTLTPYFTRLSVNLADLRIMAFRA